MTDAEKAVQLQEKRLGRMLANRGFKLKIIPQGLMGSSYAVLVRESGNPRFGPADFETVKAWAKGRQRI